jgi:hypothetical protein
VDQTILKSIVVKVQVDVNRWTAPRREPHAVRADATDPAVATQAPAAESLRTDPIRNADVLRRPRRRASGSASRRGRAHCASRRGAAILLRFSIRRDGSAMMRREPQPG